MVFAQVSSLPSVGAGSNFPIEGLQLFSRELGGLAKVDDAALISLDPCGRHLENPCVSCYFGNGSSTTVFRNRGEPRYQATGAKTMVRITTTHQYRLSSLRMAASCGAPRA